MTLSRDRPLRRKLLLMTMVTSGAALALASGGFLAWDIVQARSEVRSEVEAQARLVAKPFDPHEVALLVARLTRTTTAGPM